MPLGPADETTASAGERTGSPCGEEISRPGWKSSWPVNGSRRPPYGRGQPAGDRPDRGRGGASARRRSTPVRTSARRSSMPTSRSRRTPKALSVEPTAFPSIGAEPRRDAAAHRPRLHDCRQLVHCPARRGIDRRSGARSRRPRPAAPRSARRAGRSRRDSCRFPSAGPSRRRQLLQFGADRTSGRRGQRVPAERGRPQSRRGSARAAA